MAKKTGVRHIDRLLSAMFDILEDPNQTPELRVDTGKIILEALGRSGVGRRKNSPEARAIKQMMGGGKPPNQNSPGVSA